MNISYTGGLEDALIRKKIHDLAPSNPEHRKGYENRIAAEIARLEKEAFGAREKRIALEKLVLSQSPAQRKNNILDYIRRGRLTDQVEILSELIQATPDLLDSGLIDFSKEDYDEQGTIKEILGIFHEIEKEIRKEDQKVKTKLLDLGISYTGREFLTAPWAKEHVTGSLLEYKKNIEAPINPKNPLAGNPEKYKEIIREKIRTRMEKEMVTIHEQAFDRIETNPDQFQISEELEAETNPIKTFLYKKCPVFMDVPKLSEYKGGRITELPSFISQRIHPGVRIVERDKVPEFEGGVIFDGNFGYDEDGKPITPEDRIIIDHHDKFDEKKYDTATIMAGRFWREGGKAMRRQRRELKPYETETKPGKKRLITMINSPDSDALLSLWSFRNPGRSQQYKTILTNISQCGDFLTGSGVMEYGATARDYEYIIRNYLKACQEKMKGERVIDLLKILQTNQERLEELNSEKKKIDDEIGNLCENDDQIRVLEQTLHETKKSPLPPRDKGIKIKESQQKIEIRKKEIAATLFEKKTTLEKTIAELGKENERIEKTITERKQPKISSEENAKIVSHFLEIIEDIITNPFQYQAFLLPERRAETESIEHAKKLYEEGDIEIMPYGDDPDMLILSGLKKKDFPRFECIDGLYFFLRKREDLNRKLIVTIDKQSYVTAINTQDKRDFIRYDFNELVDRLKHREDEMIRDILERRKTELGAEKNEKKRSELEREIQTLESAQRKNKLGQLWRNRTQLIFSFRSYIPREEYLTIVYQWKKEQDSKQPQKGNGKGKSPKKIDN